MGPTLTMNDRGRDDGWSRRLSEKALCKGTLALGAALMTGAGAFAGEVSPSRLRFLDKSRSASMLTGAVAICVGGREE